MTHNIIKLISNHPNNAYVSTIAIPPLLTTMYCWR